MKITWHDFDKKIRFDVLQLKGFDLADKIEALYDSIDFDQDADNVCKEDIEKMEQIYAFMRDEHEHPDNREYLEAVHASLDLCSLINNSTGNGVHFRLDDGRQLGPITSADTLLELAGDGAILLAYGVEAEQLWEPLGRRDNRTRRSFSKEALDAIKKAKYASTDGVEIIRKMTEIIKLFEDTKPKPITIVVAPTKETFLDKVVKFFTKK